MINLKLKIHFYKSFKNLTIFSKLYKINDICRNCFRNICDNLIKIPIYFRRQIGLIKAQKLIVPNRKIQNYKNRLLIIANFWLTKTF